MTPEMQKLLDQMETEIRAAFEAAIARVTSSAQIALLEDAIRARDAQRFWAVLNMDPTFFAALDMRIQQAFFQGGVAILGGLPMLRDPFLAGVWLSVLMDATHAPKHGPASGQAI